MKKEIRILIMEDSPFWGKMLDDELRKLGIECDWVKNGRLGLEQIQRDNVDYDGIITDVQMPVMDGLEATRRIRELGFEKPIIGFSSKIENEDINKGIDAGMDGYIKKYAGKREVIEHLLNKLEILKE